MSKKKHVTVRCWNCGNLFRYGERATWDGFRKRKFCDACKGVERDAHGYAWEPGETEATFVNVGDSLDKAYIVTREEAFRVKP